MMRNLVVRALKLKSPVPAAAPAKFTSSVANLAGDDDEELNLNLNLARTPSVAVTKPSLLQPRVVVFDGVCRLCHTGVKWIIKADKYEKIKFCCLQSKTAEPYMELCGVKREDMLRNHRFIFIEGLAQYHQASTAALKVLSYLPFPYSALTSLSVIPTPLRDAIYDYIAKQRDCEKEHKCLVLKEVEMLQRFIDREELLDQLYSDSDV
ncbi:uncharacterized protein LOC104908453 [Beta vulgaris subsp. vulgaris]|uniref:uncharacterized protein LOC104908453 n=1 Tax=Beta vulgaris subsp. vulgaris TaxID=3555 RepID=UPI0020369046|nr:uncharacterized protein LOC104908453 [Beta vulgaris subsp. vulgaris]